MEHYNHRRLRLILAEDTIFQLHSVDREKTLVSQAMQAQIPLLSGGPLCAKRGNEYTLHYVCKKKLAVQGSSQKERSQIELAA